MENCVDCGSSGATISYGLGYLCDTCYDDDYFSCDGCNDIISNENYSHDGYCYDCAPCDDDDDDNYNEDSSIIKSYSYKPKPKFLKAGNEKSELFYGIELEVERSKIGIPQVQLAKKIQNESWYFKTDGSLSDGFEIVTEPMTYGYIQKNKDSIFNLLGTLKEHKYLSYKRLSCGMHVHMSKNCFGTWQLYRFMKFFVENKNFIFKISQRKEGYLERWASIETEDSKTLMKKAVKKESIDGRRYVAINLLNDKTIEIRIFRGTLNPQSFFKNIEFCDSMFYFTRDNKSIELNRYIDFIMHSDYKNLKKFIIDKNLI